MNWTTKGLTIGLALGAMSSGAYAQQADEQIDENPSEIAEGESGNSSEEAPIDLTPPVELEPKSSISVEGGELGTQGSITEGLELRDRSPHYWRNLAELGAVIGGGTAWYWINRDRQVADWDYPSWKSKLTFDSEIMIFDNNPFQVNYSWHTFAGGSSHWLGRSNGLGIYESFAFGTMASVFWEYGIEARELISLNDLMMTNMVGLPTGEYLHRLAQYVHQGQEGWGWDLARWTVGFPHTVHSMMDEEEVEVDLPLTAGFRWFYRLDNSEMTRQDGDSSSEREQSGVQHTIGFEGTMVAMDGYNLPGKSSDFFGKANFSDFSVSLSRGEDDASATRVEANTLLLGWRFQDIPEENVEGIGKSLNVGMNVGFRYQREQYGIWQDRLGGLHAPGLGLQSEFFGDKWRFAVSANGNFDLMGVNSMPWQQYRQERDDLGKSILQNSGYYYAYGLSSRVKAEAQYDRFGIGGRMYAGSYRSIQGFDREKNGTLTMEEEASGKDTFFDYEIFAKARVYNEAYLSARLGRYQREGELEEFSAEEELVRASIELGAAF